MQRKGSAVPRCVLSVVIERNSQAQASAGLVQVPGHASAATLSIWTQQLSCAGRALAVAPCLEPRSNAWQFGARGASRKASVPQEDVCVVSFPLTRADTVGCAMCRSSGGRDARSPTVSRLSISVELVADRFVESRNYSAKYVGTSMAIRVSHVDSTRDDMSWISIAIAKHASRGTSVSSVHYPPRMRWSYRNVLLAIGWRLGAGNMPPKKNS